MKNILVTGGLGFIGFNALRQWKKARPRYEYIVVDNETYAAQFMLDQKKKWCADNDIKTFRLDISDCSEELDSLVKAGQIDTIVNFAAESHVDNSIKNPMPFFKTNIKGTVNLLNLAREYELRFHQIGTDEVYGITRPEDDAFEDAPLKPSSPYSSSKCSADLIALSYFHTYGTNVTVSNCTNNAGEFQHGEKLIPTVIRHALADEKIPVYGDGLQRRHWIDVDDHNAAIMDMLENGEAGRRYNIAPPDENYISNMDIIEFILGYLGKPMSLVEHITDRPGHDTSYFIKSAKYNMKTPYVEFMPRIVDWYRKEAYNV